MRPDGREFITLISGVAAAWPIAAQAHAFTIAGAVFLVEAAWAQGTFRTEVYPVQTVTLSTADFLLGKKDGKPATIAGELRIPTPGTARLPAVVFVHGAGGIGFNYGMWAGELNKAGFATFVADSFTGRGITNIQRAYAPQGAGFAACIGFFSTTRLSRARYGTRRRQPSSANAASRKGHRA
jgi:dipeptidyl aminopeptidase/acylaminoacyl peptidase